MSARDQRVVRGVVRLALLSWPAPERRRDGSAILQTVLDQLRHDSRAAERPSLWLAGECASIVAAGGRLRIEVIRAAWATLRTGLVGDLRFCARSLARHRGFSATAVASLAIGAGGCAAVLGLAHQVLLGPSPFTDPERLVLVWNTFGDRPERVRVSAPDVAVLRDRSRSLERLSFVNRVDDGAIETPEPGPVRHVRIAVVTPDLFETLGAGSAHGLVDATALAGSASGSSAVLSHAIWTEVFAADPTIVGRTARIDGVPTSIVGVLESDFALELPPDAGIATDIDVWLGLSVPLSAFQRDDGRHRDQDSDNTGVAIGRLAPASDIVRARAELAEIGRALQSEVPGYASADLRVDVRPLRADATAHARSLLSTLMVGASVLLLVAALNLATLVLARGRARRGEIVVRRALGASGGSIARTLVLEHVLLIGVGFAAALTLALAGVDLLASWLPAGLSSALHGGGAQARVVASATSAACGLIAVVGFAPSTALVLWDVRNRDVAGRLRRGGATRLGSALVLGEIALACVLVSGSAVLLRSADRLHEVRPGFDPQGALSFGLSMRVPDRYGGPADRARLMRRIEDELGGLPGVRGVGLVGALPLGGRRWTQPYGLPGEAEHEWQDDRADFRVATSGYFDAMGVRLLDGRTFTREEDLSEDRRVVVVDELLARRVAPDGSAVGAVLGIPLDGAAVRAEIVGVVEHVRHDDLARDGRPAIYVPYRQEASRDVAIVLRTDGDPAALAPEVGRTIAGIDPLLPVYDVVALTEYVDAAVEPTRFALSLVSIFAALTLLAAAIGLYGVVGYDVGRRTQEIGLRMAVGASTGEVLRGVLVEGIALGVGGLAAGALLSVGLLKVLEPLIYEVSYLEASTLLPTLLVVLLVSVAATWPPARRASRLDPREALRAE